MSFLDKFQRYEHYTMRYNGNHYGPFYSKQQIHDFAKTNRIYSWAYAVSIPEGIDKFKVKSPNEITKV